MAIIENSIQLCRIFIITVSSVVGDDFYKYRIHQSSQSQEAPETNKGRVSENLIELNAELDELETFTLVMSGRH